MRTHLTRLREALMLLLVGSAVLFAIGSTIERHQHHKEPAAAAVPAEGPQRERTTGGGVRGKEQLQ